MSGGSNIAGASAGRHIRKRGNRPTSRSAANIWEISPLTGSMQVGKYDDSPTDMKRQTSKFSVSANWAYSYGFYDSGAGIGDLTNHDQSYVYVTPDVSNWMGWLTRQDGAMATAPFHRFVLPGSHDAGTYGLDALWHIADNAAFIGLLFGLLGLAVAQMSKSAVVEIAQNFAVTQKDDVKTQLDMGARYFDFRPGTCAPGIFLDGIYHQHAVIPGVSYELFLKDMLAWLVAHPTEIAVLCVGFAGFSADSMKPSYDTLNGIMTNALKAAPSITVTDQRDFRTSYADLIKYSKRLFVLYAPETGAPITATKYDSYNGDVYATTKSSNIIGALNGMSKAGQAGFDYTVLQLQGTASTASKAIAGTIANASKSGSPLMSTKAAFDRTTYPWVIANARKNLGDGQVIVLLNDFVDNALAINAMKTMSPKFFG